MRAPSAFDLPCPWAPLQSMTAAASRLTLNSRSAPVRCTGQSHRAHRVVRLRTRLRDRTPEGVWPSHRNFRNVRNFRNFRNFRYFRNFRNFRYLRCRVGRLVGRDQRAAKPGCSRYLDSRCFAQKPKPPFEPAIGRVATGVAFAGPVVGRSLLPSWRTVTGDGAQPIKRITGHRELHPIPGRSRGLGASSSFEAAGPTEVGTTAAKTPFWMGATEVELVLQGTLGFWARCSPRRSGVVHGPSLREPPPTGDPPCRPRWRPKPQSRQPLPGWLTGARHAAWDMNDSSHGVRSPSAFRAQAITVLVCLTGTVRSQGFSPSQRFDPAWTAWLCFAPLPPMGFGNGLQSFSHSASRNASRRPLLSCRSSWFQPTLGHPGSFSYKS